MRTFAFGLVTLLAGCNEYNLSTDHKPPVETEEEEPPMVAIDQPDIEVSPQGIDFGFLAKDCPSDKLPVTVTNVGLADLEIQSIELNGGEKANFRVHGGDPIVLAPDESTVFEVDFMATDYALYEDAAVTVTSNDPDEPEVDVGLQGEGLDAAVIEELFDQEAVDASDVLWVVDNSGSMSEEIDELAINFSVFINKFVSLGLDYHIGVVTTDMDDPTQSGRLQGPVITTSTVDPIAEFEAQTALGSSGSGDERGMDAAYAALTSPLVTNENAGFLRSDSLLSIIVVTDEEDSSQITGQPTFVNWLDALQQGGASMSSFSAIAGPEKKGLIPIPCVTFTTGASADPTERYPKVARATGGEHINICQANWVYNLTFLANTAAGLRLRFDLAYPVTDPTQITVEVDGNPVANSQTNGWWFDDTTNSVVFDGTAIPPEGSEVSIHYPMETECAP